MPNDFIERLRGYGKSGNGYTLLMLVSTRLQAAQGTTDQGFDGSIRFRFHDLADGLAGIDLLVSESDEGQLGIGGGGGNIACRGILPGIGHTHLVLEFEDDALRCFLAQAADPRKLRHIARDHT